MSGTISRPAQYAPSASLYRRSRHLLRSYVAEHPRVYVPLAPLKYRNPIHNVEVIGPDTELVIDGYTRSAATFAVYAFQLSQDRPTRLAHHLHAPAQLIAAARRGIPALALIRKPPEAILSQIIRCPRRPVALRDGLVAYSRFYECLRPYRQSFVIGEFRQVTQDFGSVVRQLNKRFGTDFAEFVPNDANIRELFEFCKLRGTRSRELARFESGLVTREQLRTELPAIRGAALVDEQEAWVPSEDRQRAKEALHDRWLQPSLAKLRARAQQAYQEFLAG
jgi:hypothetical protein